MKNKISSLPLLLLLFRAHAWTIPTNVQGPDTALDAKRDAFHVFPRDPYVRTKCTVPMYQIQNVQNQRVVTAASNKNVSLPLWRRTMTLPGEEADMDDFMKGEMAEVDQPIIWDRYVGVDDDGQPIPEDMNTATFEELKDEAVSFGTGGLCGCTALAIVSRKGVYIAHYWESIAFDMDEEWEGAFRNTADAFQKTVIKGLRDGIRRRRESEQDSLKNQAAKLADDWTFGYLMIPSKTAKGVDDGYRNSWNAIKATVGEFIPRLKDNNLWKELKYDALNQFEDALKETAKGKLLFKYDPNHNGKKKAVLFYEDHREPAHDDEW